MHNRFSLIIALALALLPIGVQAECGEGNPRCVAVGEWQIQLAVGAGVRTNPLTDSSDIPLVVIPQITYYGQHFFIDNLDIGLTLVESPRLMLNAIVTPGSDGLYFFRSKLNRLVLDGGIRTVSNAPFAPDEYNYPPPEQLDDRQFGDIHGEDGEPVALVRPKLEKRRLAGMAGFEASTNLGPTEWQIQVLHDVTRVHEGQEARLAMSTGGRRGNHDIGLTLGLSWKSDKLMDYYYGVSEAEAYTDRPAYTAGKATTPFVRLRWGKPITPQWRLLGSVQYERLSSTARNSPIIEDDQVIQLFFGGVYHF